MEEKLIAPCGMNCGLCVNYQAGKYDLKKKGLNRMYCPGCIPRGQHCLHMKAHCELVGKGLVRFCYECDSFPCKRLKSLDQRYRTKYHLSMIENLKRIKEERLDYFLQEQESEWRCPECGELICCHNGLCLNCQIDVLIGNKRYRWDEELI